ncbi:unnamed protein product, partial [Prorocentrum cordatum]
DVYAVSEMEKKVSVRVMRGGNEHAAASCRYRTVPGTALKDQDYVHAQGQLDWLPGDTNEKTIDISIVEDKNHESTEEFYVELLPVPGAGIVGLKNIATVVVLDSDSPGELTFECDSVSVAEASSAFEEADQDRARGGLPRNAQVCLSYRGRVGQGWQGLRGRVGGAGVRRWSDERVCRGRHPPCCFRGHQERDVPPHHRAMRR